MRVRSGQSYKATKALETTTLLGQTGEVELKKTRFFVDRIQLRKWRPIVSRTGDWSPSAKPLL